MRRRRLHGAGWRPFLRCTTSVGPASRFVPAALVLAAAAALGGGLGAQAADLSFAERVRAQEAIERVYYSHQLGAERPFAEVHPRAELEKKVRTYLAQSAALTSYWRSPITPAALAAEVRRMESRTRMPQRLAELFRALGDDPLLIEECLARPLLADRLARRFLASDTRFMTSAGRAPTWDEWWERAEPGLIRAIPAHMLLRRANRMRTGSLLASGARFEPQSAPNRETPLAGDMDATGGTGRGPAAGLFGGPNDTQLGIPSCIPDDTWHNGSFDDTPSPRHVHTAVWTGTLMIIWGGYPAIQTGARYDPATDSWASTSLTGAPDGRYAHTAVWTGERMVVWGGRSGAGPVGTGGRYDPVGDTWEPTSQTNAPAARSSHTATMVGGRMVVWGGTTGTAFFRSGASYDPVGDTWQTISLTGAPLARSGHVAVWTGSRILVWGGIDAAGHLGDGGSYDPVGDAWTPIATRSAPAPRDGHSAVWTGSVMIVWGGNNAAIYFDSGGQYDPVADRWSPTTRFDAPDRRAAHTAVWTGDRMVLFGGFDGVNYLKTGPSYDPVADHWSFTEPVSQPGARGDHTAVWTGSLMIVWGGIDNFSALDTGGRYDPSSNTWTPTATSQAPTGRGGHTALWTGSAMIVWGGLAVSSIPQNTGGIYDPATDTWRSTSLVNAPSSRSSHTAVWTGRVMLIWGGLGTAERPTDPVPRFNTGGRYDPATDTWYPIPVTGAPIARYRHSAVWTDQSMIVWGGVGEGIDLRSGGRYDPRTDRWSSTTLVGAPDPRASHSAVWTGSRMVIWGGYLFDGQFHSLDTGGRYDPQADAWSPLSTTGTASPRQDHVAVWTGSRVLIWGGNFYDGLLLTPLGDGGSYDPVSDTWAGVSFSGAPSSGLEGSGVWTGHELLIWSGPTDAGRYDPQNDTWTAISSDGAPSPRSEHSTVWTGSDLIVWGGVGVTEGDLSSGGRYALGYADDDDGDGLSECGGDCNDSDAAVKPGATEVCDGHDNDCDGVIDEGVICGWRITNPLDGDTVDCRPDAPPPSLTWAIGSYEGYHVFISRSAAFGTRETITSGGPWLRKDSWVPKAKLWKKICSEGPSALFIKVQGLDRDLPRTDPARKAFSPVVQVGVDLAAQNKVP